MKFFDNGQFLISQGYFDFEFPVLASLLDLVSCRLSVAKVLRCLRVNVFAQNLNTGTLKHKNT